jgi:hypothetical protein
MSELTRYTFGASVKCADEACGRVSRVVIDPATMTVTHLVVEPDDPHQLGRLVPLDLLDVAPGAIGIGCTMTEFYQLPHAENTQPGRGTGRPARYMAGRSGLGVYGPGPQTFTYDVLPAGKVALRGDDPVDAIDGHIGHITGVAADPASRQVAYLLLHEGHPLGKDIAIPVSAATRIDAGIQVGITKHDVKHLPPAKFQ